MKKLIKYPGYTLSGILSFVIIQSYASAANGKAPDGTLTGVQIVGGVLVLLLVIVIALIKGKKSMDITIPS